jgi:hypothetical protein
MPASGANLVTMLAIPGAGAVVGAGCRDADRSAERRSLDLAVGFAARGSRLCWAAWRSAASPVACSGR